MLNKFIPWFKKNIFLVVSYVFIMMIIVTAIVAAAHVGYSLAEMQCAIEHNGASAPQGVVLIMLIPYGFVELILLAAAITSKILHKRSQPKDLTWDATTNS
jgi:hypothetical protein